MRPVLFRKENLGETFICTAIPSPDSSRSIGEIHIHISPAVIASYFGQHHPIPGATVYAPLSIFRRHTSEDIRQHHSGRVGVIITSLWTESYRYGRPSHCDANLILEWDNVGFLRLGQDMTPFPQLSTAELKLKTLQILD